MQYESLFSIVSLLSISMSSRQQRFRVSSDYFNSINVYYYNSINVYYTILYHTILHYTISYYTIPSILAKPISNNRLGLKFFQIDIKSNHLSILIQMQYQSIKSTHFHFWSGLANFESKVGAENHFKSSPISNINPSNQHTFIFGVASTIPSPPSTCDETPNTLLLPVIIALVPLNTLLIPDIDTMIPVLAFIIFIRPVEFIS